MRNYSGGKRSERGSDFGKKRGRDSGKSSMHQATCDNCGKDCEVPFKPSSGKPIYCSKCFDKNQNDEPRKYSRERNDRKFGGGDSRRRNFSDRESIGQNKENDIDHLKKEIKILNKKVDEVLEILNELLSESEYQDEEEYNEETE